MKRNDVLKLVAMITMVIDHIGYMFGEELRQPLYFMSYSLFGRTDVITPDLFRIIGRIAFPIFAYMVAMGWKHTRSRKKYFQRLCLFGLVSQLPYMFFNPGMEMHFMRLNVIILFAFSLGALYLLDLLIDSRSWVVGFMLLCYIALPMVYEQSLNGAMFSYSTYGVLMIMLFYKIEKPIPVVLAYFGLTALYNMALLPISYAHWYGFDYVRENYRPIIEHIFTNSTQQMSVLALPFIVLLPKFNFKFTLNKFVGYWFYPGHMAIIMLIRIVFY